jgi:hypothetical protein
VDVFRRVVASRLVDVVVAVVLPGLAIVTVDVVCCLLLVCLRVGLAAGRGVVWPFCDGVALCCWIAGGEWLEVGCRICLFLASGVVRVAFFSESLDAFKALRLFPLSEGFGGLVWDCVATIS